MLVRKLGNAMKEEFRRFVGETGYWAYMDKDRDDSNDLEMAVEGLYFHSYNGFRDGDSFLISREGSFEKAHNWEEPYDYSLEEKFVVEDYDNQPIYIYLLHDTLC